MHQSADADSLEKIRGAGRMKLFNFFIGSMKLRLEEQMMYKANFIIRMITLMSFDLVLPLVTILIYLKSNGFPGWDFNQILLFQGIFIFVNSLDRMFFQRVDWSLGYDVKSGVFDRYLLYPMNTLAYITFTNFGFEHIADFVLGIGLVIYALIKLKLTLTFLNLSLFIGSLLIALLFIFSLAMLKFSIIVKFVKVGRLGEFFRAVKNFGQYPVNIYSTFLSSIFRYIIPLTLLAYIPSMILLDAISSGFLIAVAVTLVFFVFTLVLWKDTLKHYTSAGG